jgi:hypothetical protein
MVSAVGTALAAGWAVADWAVAAGAAAGGVDCAGAAEAAGIGVLAGVRVDGMPGMAG